MRQIFDILVYKMKKKYHSYDSNVNIVNKIYTDKRDLCKLKSAHNGENIKMITNMQYHKMTANLQQ